MTTDSLFHNLSHRLRRKDKRSKAEVIDSIRKLTGLPDDMPDEEVERRGLAFQKHMHDAMLPMREALENAQRSMRAMVEAMERRDRA